MNELIPLMVIIPIFSALILNLFHKKDKTVKIIAILTAIILPIIPLIASYGLHYFGGHAPLYNSTLLSILPHNLSESFLTAFHPAITYSFESLQKIFILILGIVAFFAIFNSLSLNKKVSGPYMFLMFMGTLVSLSSKISPVTLWRRSL